MIAKDFSERKERMNAALAASTAAWEKKYGEKPSGACLVEKVDSRTPFDEVADGEERAGLREPTALPLFDEPARLTIFDELTEFEAAYAREGKDASRIAMEAIFWMLGFFFAGGPHPGEVMRRVYALVKKFAPELVWNMGYRRIGDLLGETGANMQWRVEVLLNDYFRAKGVTNVKMPGEKTEEACEIYSAVQAENSSRVGGKRSGKHKAKRTQ